MEILSAVDILSAIVDIYDRCRAPKRLQGRTRYLLDRHVRLRDACALSGSSLTNASDEHDPRDPHPSPAYMRLYRDNEHRFQPDAARQHIAFQRVLHRTKMALRRDDLQDICDQMDRLQTDHILEQLLDQSYSIRNSLRDIDLKVTLGSCKNFSAAEKILSSSHVHLDDLPSHLSPEFRSVSRWDDRLGHVLPLWPIGNTAPHLFANADSHRRFAFLVSVATALCTTHDQKWYHRRLSTANILVRRTHCDEDNCVRMISSTFVKILHFRCPITTGCYDGCANCRRDLQTTAVHQDFTNHSGNQKSTIFFSPTPSYPSRNSPSEEGQRIDVSSFASLILWLYSGHKLPPNFNIDDEGNEEIISYVPWPLRWIIMDHSRISMQTVLIFLQAILDKQIDPHSISRVLMKEPTSTSTDQTKTLYEACLRCVLYASYTEEPEGAIHFGLLWEDKAKTLLRSTQQLTSKQQDHADFALKQAFLCYDSAAKLGEGYGYVYMARMLADWISGSLPNSPNNVSHAAMLYFLFEGAACDNRFAMNALRRVPIVGVTFPRKLFRESEEDDYDIFFMDRFPEYVVEIGKCWRRGKAGLPVNYEQAGAWLMTAKNNLMYAPGALELGLLKIQIAQSAEQILSGVEDVRKAAQSGSTQAASAAYFWLARWHHYGLQMRPGLLQTDFELSDNEYVIPKNNTLALQYVQLAAKSGHPAAMALYSRFYRLGVSSLTKNREKALEWNRKARRLECADAYYGFGLMKLDTAKEKYSLYLEKHGAQNVHDDPGNESRSRTNPSRRWRPRILSRMETIEEDTDTGASLLLEVETLLEQALACFTETGKKLATTQPEEDLNPLPYYTAGKTILKNIGMWSRCASSVRRKEETVRSFKSRMCTDAMNLMRKAAEMDQIEGWRRLRVDFLELDIEVMNKARNELQRSATASTSSPQ